MKSKKPIVALGIIFGLTLFGIAYLSLVYGVIISLAYKLDLFAYVMMYGFGVLGIITIIGACLALKNIKATRVMLTIPLVLLLAVFVFLLIIVPGFSPLVLLYVADFVIGLIPTILAFKYKEPQQNPQEISVSEPQNPVV